QVILMYHNGLYSARSTINWLPIIARLVGTRSVTSFTNCELPSRGRVQVLLSSFLGYGALRQYPIGLLGASSKMVFCCDADRSTLLGIDPQNLKARSEIATLPNTLPVDSVADRSHHRESLGVTDKDLLVGYFGLLYPG